MTSVTATEIKQQFGKVFLQAMKEPVSILKNGREQAVLLSAEEYRRLEALDDAYWVNLAKKGEKSGYIGKEKSEQLLQNMLKG